MLAEYLQSTYQTIEVSGSPSFATTQEKDGSTYLVLEPTIEASRETFKFTAVTKDWNTAISVTYQFTVNVGSIAPVFASDPQSLERLFPNSRKVVDLPAIIAKDPSAIDVKLEGEPAYVTLL